MSSPTLRAAIRADWARLTPTLPYYDTVNKALPKPVPPATELPDVWGSLGFLVESRRHVTMGANPWVEERGIVTFMIAIKSGKSDIDMQQAYNLMHAWDGWSDTTGDMWFQNVNAPDAIELEADGDWYMVGVAANYRINERVSLP